MEEKETQIKLTAGEIAQLWVQYLNDSSSNCVLTYFLEKAEDDEIKPIIEYALELSKSHKNLLHKLPYGNNGIK